MPKTEDDVGKVWDLAERIGLCMLSTTTGRDIHARPMAVQSKDWRTHSTF